jgi:hypothetical protein
MFSNSFAGSKPQFWRKCFGKTYSRTNKAIYGGFKRHFNGTLGASQEFQHCKSGTFYQDAPSLQNQFLGDVFLRNSLRRILPLEVGMHLSREGCPLEGGVGATQT